MIIDTHIHVIAPDPERYPFRDQPPGQQRSWFHTKAVDAPELLRDMDAAAVDRGMLVQAFTAYGYDNSYAADAAQQFPDRLRALCTVEADGRFPENVRTWVRERGCAGVRLLAAGIDSPRWLVGEDAAPLWAHLADEGLVLDIAVNGDDLPAVRALAGRFPALPVVVDHVAMLGLGGPRNTGVEALFALTALGNVHVKISPLLWQYTAASGGDLSEALGSLVAEFGPERLLWGSNYTATFEPSYQALVGSAEKAFAAFGQETAEHILFRTADRLWWS